MTYTEKEQELFELGILVSPEKSNYINSNYRKIPEAVRFLESIYPEVNHVPTKVYLYVNGLESIPLCKECQTNPVKLRNTTLGFREFCSVKCMSINKETDQKKRDTCRNNHGVDYSFQSDKINKKTKKAIYDLYGVDNISQNSDIKRKKRDTFLSNLGVDRRRILSDNEFLQSLLDELHPSEIEERYGVSTITIYRRIRKSGLMMHQRNLSLPEKKIKDFLIKNRVNFINGYRLGKMEIDFYLPDHKIGIEFNGVYWHSEEAGRGQFYHWNKTNLCISEGIQVFHIYEDEWDSDEGLCKRRILDIIEGKRLSVERLERGYGIVDETEYELDFVEFPSCRRLNFIKGKWSEVETGGYVVWNSGYEIYKRKPRN